MATDNDYEVLEKIGQGSFGIIRKVRRRTDGEVLCRKEISYTRMTDREKEQLHAELRILESLRHPNIVQYCHRQHLKSSHDLHLYMEYCGNGDLGGYIRKLKEKNRFADEEFIWAILAQLVGALYRCHYGEDPPTAGKEGGVKKGKALVSKQGHTVILHRDLKPENVFLGDNNSVKLGDFGLSKIMASHDFASTYVGTPFYMSPEICAAERYSHHSDVWSLGCIIYELATRTVPFEARSHVELVMKIKNGRIKPLPIIYSQELNEVISWCLKVDPRSRPDTAQLLNVPNVKVARTRLEQATALGQLEKIQHERDSAVSKLSTAQKQIMELQAEVSKLRDAGKKIEMEWHARATLAIDQKVQEITERQKSELIAQFSSAVDQRAEEKLALHLASLPTSHATSQSSDVSVHIRSNTPPAAGGKVSALTSFTSTLPDLETSSVPELSEDSLLSPTDLTSLSLNDAMSEAVAGVVADDNDDDFSPLARRNKALPPPKKAVRKPFTRAKTLANCNFHAASASALSPMDVHMADPSPMRGGGGGGLGMGMGMGMGMGAGGNVKGLSLSPRRNGLLQQQQQHHHQYQNSRLAGEPVKRNIFSLATEKENRPPVRGRTLLELQAQTPAKWDPLRDEMPSPFIKRR